MESKKPGARSAFLSAIALLDSPSTDDIMCWDCDNGRVLLVDGCPRSEDALEIGASERA